MSANDRRMGVQPWNVVDTWPLEQQIGFYRGNLLKYTMRLDDKDDRLGNAEKAAHYAEKLVEVLKLQYPVAPAPWAAPVEAPSQEPWAGLAPTPTVGESAPQPPAPWDVK